MSWWCKNVKPQLFCDIFLDIIFQGKTRAKAKQIKIRLDQNDTRQWSKTAPCLLLGPQHLGLTESHVSSGPWVKRTFSYRMSLYKHKEAGFQFCSVYAYPSGSLLLFFFLHSFSFLLDGSHPPLIAVYICDPSLVKPVSFPAPYSFKVRKNTLSHLAEH